MCTEPDMTGGVRPRGAALVLQIRRRRGMPSARQEKERGRLGLLTIDHLELLNAV